MNDPFATLGVPRRFSLSVAELEQRLRDVSRAVHPDRHATDAPAVRRVALEQSIAVNDAFRTLRDPLSRALSLLALHGVGLGDGDRASTALLTDIMELREALDEARGQPERIAALRAVVSRRIAEAERVLAETFDQAEGPDTTALAHARTAAVGLRYLRRFEEEADAMEE